MKKNPKQMISLAIQLKNFRLENNIKQRALAAYLGCHVSQLSRWEGCRMYPRKKWLDIMAERGVLDV